MDPEQTLESLRELIRWLPFEIDEMGLIDLDRAQEIFNNFTALDEWLTKGGPRPEDWE